MRTSISKSEIAGKVIAPSSKSYTIRGLMCAALAKGQSEIVYPLSSDDTEVALDTLSKVGVPVREKKAGWQVTGGNLCEPDSALFCRESAATLRFMTAICSLIPGTCSLTMSSSLAQRPIEPLLQALKQLGVNCQFQTEKACVTVKGGKLRGGLTELPGNISSQFVSALLLISPLADKDMKIRLTTLLESQPYVLMTLECLQKFGIKVSSSEDLTEFETVKQNYQPTKYIVEGDWSSASYLLALGALSGRLRVENLNPESLQGDKVILNLLKNMGALVTIKPNSVTVEKSKLKAIKANLSNCIDLLPTMAVLAAMAEGVSEFTGIERARLKESNRVLALREGLEKMGVKIIEEKDSLTVTGSDVRGAVIDSQADHRIAMAFSLLGAVVGNTIINDAECVSKTYPEYWETLKSIGGKVKIDGE